MNDLVETGFDALTEVASGIPAPVKKSFFRVLEELLGGLTSIPVAMARRPARALDATTDARSAVTAALARGVAENALRDPAVMQAAEEIYLPTKVRKATNRIRVAQSAAEHISESEANKSESGAKTSESREPDEDWINVFARFAEDASSERLQDMFGRILAGEVIKPGSFGLATLRAVSELDQAIAHDFSMAWSKSVGTSVDYSSDWQRGAEFSRWKRLAEAGLLAPNVVGQYLPAPNPFYDGTSAWTPMGTDEIWLTVFFESGCSSKWNNIPFTRVGRELGSVLPRPDYEGNIRRAAESIPKQGVKRIQLSTPSGGDYIWNAAP